MIVPPIVLRAAGQCNRKSPDDLTELLPEWWYSITVHRL